MRVGRKKRTKGPDTANKLPQGECVIYFHVFVSPCVGGSKVLPRTLYCIKYQLAGVFLVSAK